ncbi:helix-turn-helix domain-containing protein [Spirosoma areae]
MPRTNHPDQQDFLLLQLEDINATFPQGMMRPYYQAFHINRLEGVRPHISGKQFPYRKTVTEFLLVTQGSTVRAKGIDRHEISANTFFFVPAYQIRTAESMSNDIRGFFCHFQTDIFKNCFLQNDVLDEFPFLQYIGNPLIRVPDEAMPRIMHLMERLEAEYQNTNPNEFKLFATYLLALFFELNRFIGLDAKTKDAASLLTQQYKNALMQHIYDIHTIAGYAAHLSVSQTYLNRCLQTTMGKTAHDMLNEMLLLEAKTLLKQTALSISEIAYKIGKQDHSDFSRFFKHHTGSTPKEFRKGE